jgi:hypothetical protein
LEYSVVRLTISDGQWLDAYSTEIQASGFSFIRPLAEKTPFLALKSKKRVLILLTKWRKVTEMTWDVDPCNIMQL